MNEPCPSAARRSLLVRLSAAAAAAAGAQALPGGAAQAAAPVSLRSAGPDGGGDYRVTARVLRCYRLARY